jgi:hypothetical protein
MKAVLSIFFFVVFLLIGLRVSGPLGKFALTQLRFDSPDQHAQYMLYVNIGIALGVSLIGVAIGLALAPSMKRKFIRDEQ